MVPPRAPSFLACHGLLSLRLPPGKARLRRRPALHGSTELTKPKRNWIQEERRKTLGDWVAFCVACGHTLRYFDDYEGDLPAACPQCAGELRRRCPECGERFPSAFQVECEACGAAVRPAELFGGAIRKPGR